MKRLLFLLLISACCTSASQAQYSWQHLPDTGITTISRYEDVYFTDSVTGYAVTYYGLIFKTKDAGRHWALQLDNRGVSKFRSIEFLADKQTGLAGCIDTSKKIYHTGDGGNTWTDIGSSIPDTLNPNNKAICGIAHRDNSFYAVGAWFSKQATFYKSTDKGITWTCAYLDTNLIAQAIDICFTSRDTGFITGGRMPVSGKDRSVILKTTDGGSSWNSVFVDSFIAGRIWKIQAITPQLLVGSIEPYYIDTVAMVKSTDGGNTWSIIGSGYKVGAGTNTGHNTQGIGFINNQHGWLGGWYRGIFETKDGGQTWERMLFGENFNRFFVLDSTHMYAGGADIYFYGGQLPESVSVKKSPVIRLPHHLYPVTPNPAGNTVKVEFELYNSTYVLLQIVATDAKRSWELESRWLPKGHYVYYWNSDPQATAGNYIVWLGTNEIPIVRKFTLK